MINEDNHFLDKQIIGLNQETGSGTSRRSVKDVIPESRLAQFYGNFYYDDVRYFTAGVHELTITVFFYIE